MRPGGNHLGNVFLGHFLVQQMIFAFFGFDLLMGSLQFGLEFRDLAVLDLSGEVQIARALGAFLFQFGLFQLGGQDAGGVDGGFLILPLRLEFTGAFLELGQFFLDLLQTILRSVVRFLFQSGLLDLQLHDLAFQLIYLHRHGIQLHPQTAGGFVHQIHGFIGQEPVRNIAVGKRCGGHQSGITDTHTMMIFIAFLQSAQDGDGRLHTRFFHHDRLETAFQSRILFHMLAVFIQRSRADTAQFTTGQLRFEQVGRVGRSFGRAGTHQGMQLINKEDNGPVAGGHFLDKGFQTILKFTSVFRAGDHAAQIHRDQSLVLEGFRYVTADDTAGDPLHDSGLAHTGLTDQDGIILSAPGEDLHHTADLLVTSDDGVYLSGTGGGGQVAPVLLQSLKFFLRVFIYDPLVST